MNNGKGGEYHPCDDRYERHVITAWGDIHDMIEGRLEMSPIQTRSLHCFYVRIGPLIDDHVNGKAFILVVKRFGQNPVYVSNVVFKKNRIVLRLAIDTEMVQ